MSTHPALLDPQAAYRVISARDARFDGRLFVGVTSTGVYCRPICRVRTPMFKNCRFFDTPAQAEAARFRPCMKCRPEVAPGAPLAWTVMDASRTLARQAAVALDAQAIEGHASGLSELSRRLGVSDRHLRRIFQTEHGVTPLQYLQTRRLLLAKQLLTDTRLPVAQVALASGFRSLRRFNAAFADNYRISPSRLRGETLEDGTESGAPLSLKLGFRAPYAVDAMLAFLGKRSIPDVEAVGIRTVRRSLRAGTVAPVSGWVEAEFMREASLVRLRFAPELAPFSGKLVAAVRRWLDLDADSEAIDAGLAQLPGEPGIRLPGSLDAFELAVRAVLGQQVTVAAARTLARRVSDRFGEAVRTPWPEVSRCFPAPSVLAEAPPERLAELGIIRSRVGAIQELANSWPTLTLALAARDRPEALVAQLCALPGVGPWTAHYIAMRALGWPDAFPPRDVAVLKAMRALNGELAPRQLELHAQAWQPWRAYAVLRLWNSLESARP